MSTKDIRQPVTTPTHLLVTDGTSQDSNLGYVPIAELNSRLSPPAQAIAVQMAASTTVGGIQQLDNANLDFGASSFTVAQTDTVYSGSFHAFFVKRVDANNRVYWFVDTNGVMNFAAFVSGATVISFTTASIAAYYGQSARYAVSIIRETATVAGSYAVYINGVLFASGSITAAATVSLSNAGVRYINAGNVGGTAASTRAASSFISQFQYNRALSAAEVLDLSINGVALTDRGASQTELSSGAWLNTFTTSFDTFASAGASAFTASDATTKTGIRVYVAAPVKTGKNYRIEFTPTFTNATLASITASTGTGSALGFTPALTAPAIVSGQKYIVEFAGPSADRANILFNINTGAGGGSFAITDFSVKQIGLTSELLASNAQSNTGQIFDTSGNKNHALLPASGATVVGRPVSQTREVRWTNTWSGTNELQYIGGVNQAILPANAYIESIIATVTGADQQDVNVGNGADADRYAVIVPGFDVSLLSRTTDGTNLRLTATPALPATMTVAWVIRYSILEA
jgi:hypothetical protein